MKLMLGLIILAVVFTAPVAIIGSKYRDGVVTNNTYIKSLEYDKTKEIVSTSGLIFGDVLCDNSCTLDLSMTPAPDADSLQIRVFPPIGADLPVASVEKDSRYKLSFKTPSNGWHVIRLDYTINKTPVNIVKSVFVSK